ncbi:MAG: hypothetical protein AB1641_01015 [Thermodesulfobacteriota bacterium]
MSEHVHLTMEQKIFELDLSVEATSAYIVVASILTDNLRPNWPTIRSRWTVSEEALGRALEELSVRNVLVKRHSSDGEALYYTSPSSLWR